jgi:hypothetical protein
VQSLGGGMERIIDKKVKRYLRVFVCLMVKWVYYQWFTATG